MQGRRADVSSALRGSCKTQVLDAFTAKKGQSEQEAGYGCSSSLRSFCDLSGIFLSLLSPLPTLPIPWWMRFGALCSTLCSKQEFWTVWILLFCSLSIWPLNVRNHINNNLNPITGMGKRNFLLKQHTMQSWVFMILTHSNLMQRKHLSRILCSLEFPLADMAIIFWEK